ncbi:MAG TPA: 16S rRNA (adenine(1518)-N(6)/adenine(1519)-N(6))-dimethyltransferase RsmA [Candidatus Peribacteria bacterium]|nr:16S rRNA (adenine(1518)-N(6)/adenine(1519)-N(6))-dimethyltransferase RsmA [Candidatus Peribacteria bacterium]
MLAEEVRQFLAEKKIWLNTDLGQHFLVAEEVLEIIIAAAEVGPADRIVEIGPGIGILTRELLYRAAKVTAIEIDERMISLLPDFVTRGSQEDIRTKLSLVTGNALRTDLPRSPYKVVANIPYHITSPLLRHVFLETPVRPTSLTLLIQREVAENICGEGSDGLLTILVNLFGKPSLMAIVPPEAILPPPKVDSAILQIDCYPQPKADPATVTKILSLAKHAFSQKRKMLSNTLAKLPGGTEALAACGVELTRRPQTLTMEEWIGIAKKMMAATA